MTATHHRPPPPTATTATTRRRHHHLRHSLAELNLRAGVLSARHMAPLAVVDDDPTGTQTVHSIPVLADWSVGELRSVLRESLPCFYILSNTRALPRHAACARAREIGSNLRVAAAMEGFDPDRQLAVVSRGDSCLRGHYPYETDALCEGLGWPEGKVCPPHSPAPSRSLPPPPPPSLPSLWSARLM